MGKQFAELTVAHRAFIEQQKIFFVGTAADVGRVNISPKGMDCLRILGSKQIIWLNVTGSGNESSAHIQQNPRMTLLFCAFSGAPLILRVYAKAKVIHPYDKEWEEGYAQFKPIIGARQLFDLSIDLVQTSCGMAVPYFAYEGDRDLLVDWAQKRGDDGIKEYWAQKNQTSIDGLPTHIFPKES